MRRCAHSISILLLLAACHPRDSSESTIAGQRQRAPESSAADNIADVASNVADIGGNLRDYGMFEPTLRPSSANAANVLTKPRAYRTAVFGYFDDPDIMRQFTTRERAQMRVDGNAFHAEADLNGNGSIETYRTGYFEMADGTTGLFLATFERGRQIGLWTETDAVANILWISTRDGLSLWHCNCPQTGRVSLDAKGLRVKWSS